MRHSCRSFTLKSLFYSLFLLLSAFTVVTNSTDFHLNAAQIHSNTFLWQWTTLQLFDNEVISMIKAITFSVNVTQIFMTNTFECGAFAFSTNFHNFGSRNRFKFFTKTEFHATAYQNHSKSSLVRDMASIETKKNRHDIHLPTRLSASVCLWLNHAFKI